MRGVDTMKGRGFSKRAVRAGCCVCEREHGHVYIHIYNMYCLCGFLDETGDEPGPELGGCGWDARAAQRVRCGHADARCYGHADGRGCGDADRGGGRRGRREVESGRGEGGGEEGDAKLSASGSSTDCCRRDAVLCDACRGDCRTRGRAHYNHRRFRSRAECV